MLPDSPTKAKFLSYEEKVIVLERLRANNQVILFLFHMIKRGIHDFLPQGH